MSSRILTLVFTDLVDSTALKRQRGDQAFGELVDRHRALVVGLATESGGRIIDWAGDGCFLTFETPSAAVEFALRLQQAQRQNPDLPDVRTGLHMGEVPRVTLRIPASRGWPSISPHASRAWRCQRRC
jgi:class 3 adenylate cyclase